jgi:sulfur oxygenase/reductase
LGCRYTFRWFNSSSAALDGTHGVIKINHKGLFKTLDAMPSPPDYLIHTEWDATEMAQQGFTKVLVKQEISKIHDDGVMAHLIRGPYIMFFHTMMEGSSWRYSSQ